jgi:hypothetical protein
MDYGKQKSSAHNNGYKPLLAEGLRKLVHLVTFCYLNKQAV